MPPLAGTGHLPHVELYRYAGVIMSKAFMKEDSESDEIGDADLDASMDSDSSGDLGRESGDEPLGSSEKARFLSGRNYITPIGFERLKAEAHELLSVERPKVVETVAWAASNGDRSENADYQYGKRRLREIDRRLRFLQKRMDIAQVVVPEKQAGPKVLFGATVTVEDENGIEKVYQIVGIDETDAKKGRISWRSPMGMALLQSEKDDSVVVKTPRGEEELLIKRIEYKEIL